MIIHQVNTPPKALAFSFVFLFTLVVYVNSQVLSTADTIWSLYVSTSILKEGNTDLDEYASLIPAGDYRIERIGNHVYSIFPIGSSLLAVPFIFVVERVFPIVAQVNFSDYLSQHPPDQVIFGVEKIIASIITAFNAALIFLIASRFTDLFRSVIPAFIFAFGTSAWSTASRGLWQHGPSMLAITMVLYITLLAKEKPHVLQWIAFPLAFACLIRPTNGISVLVFSIYVFMVGRQYFFNYGIWLLLSMAPFLLYNYSIYGMWLPSYYLPQRLGSSPFLLEALTGNLISPSRGLLIFSPILIYGLCEIFARPREADRRTLDLSLSAILILHWVSISLFRHWYGGWSIGPRLFSDMLPIFTYFLIPAVSYFSRISQRRQAGFYLFWFLTAVSIFIHFRCARVWAPTEWNSVPTNIDQSTDRLWDWSDIQFLRGLCPAQSYQAPKCWFSQNSVKTGKVEERSEYVLEEGLIYPITKLSINLVFPMNTAIESRAFPLITSSSSSVS